MNKTCRPSPASGAFWQAEFFDPATGQLTGTSRLAVRDQRIRIVLRKFQDFIAFRLKRLEPKAASLCPGSGDGSSLWRGDKLSSMLGAAGLFDCQWPRFQK